jgi:STE24 endopeptidase
MSSQSDVATTSPESSAEMTPEQLAEAKQYGRLELVCGLADKALDVGFLAVMVALFAMPLDTWLAEFVHADTARLALIFLITTAAHTCISFPLSLYSGYTLEHRFGLSRQTFGRWLWRYAKRNVLALVFGLGLLIGLYWVIWTVGTWWWLVAAAAFFFVSVVFGQLAPVVILPLFYKIERLDNSELAARMARLAEGTGLSIQGVYRMGLSAETAKANAMLAGLGRTRRVLMGDTLLDQFTPDEIEVIFAHEIGHHVFRHIHKLIAVGVLYGVAGFWICDRVLLWWAQAQYGLTDVHELPPGTLPLLMLVLTVFALLLEPVQNVISRRYERQCDRYALERTGLRAAYVSAFRKLARLNKDDPDPHPVEVFLFHSHPPISQRLAMAGDT